MYQYFDDWLLVGQSQFVLDKSLKLGLMVNIQKSELQHTQRAIFLGMDLDTSTFLVRPSESRLLMLGAVLNSLTPTALCYLRLLGMNE